MTGTWRKSPPELVERFDDLIPDTPLAERRQMFGYPCAFVGGHMFMGLFEDRMFLRLPPADLAKLVAKQGAQVFEPIPGKPMRDLVVMPESIVDDEGVIGIWVQRALAYTKTLPPKPRKA